MNCFFNKHKKSSIAFASVILALIVCIFFCISNNLKIGEYKVIITEDYKPIGKQVQSFRQLAHYTNSSELTANNSINTSFVTELNQFTFKQAIWTNYLDIEKKATIDSWEFIFENNEGQSIRITTNPPINNPVYIKKESNPQRIKIGPHKILLTQKGNSISALLTSNTFNQMTDGRKENEVTIWIDMKNVSKDDALAISKLLCS